jgi:hypothetical protein
MMDVLVEIRLPSLVQYVSRMQEQMPDQYTRGVRWDCQGLHGVGLVPVAGSVRRVESRWGL